MAFLQMRLAFAVLCVVLVSSVSSRTIKPALRDDADAHLTTPELIAKYGYPAETHTVTTEDGYVLQMHRIPHGKNQPPDESRPPVLVQHGLMSSSADWVIMGPGIAIGYLLADAGYDVWLGNARGNLYARNHVSLNPDDKEFWQFSWHEMGVYDVPAMIDYILKETEEEKLHYIGYSMGTTMFYWFLELLGGFEFLPSNELLSMLETALCQEEAITTEVCTNALFLVCGFDSEELDMAMIPAIMGHEAISSLSFCSFLFPGKFRQYDHGAIKNWLEYGQSEPPEYNLNKITAPVALFYSDNDWLAAETDVDQLLNKLGNPLGKFRVPFDKFNHLDYMWAIHGPELVYNDIIELMSQHN
ncbi:Lipase 3 [Blattella germanica]|nr:Lipase 3 [Blattella germanica]